VQRQDAKRFSGFTLIELLVVIAIIAILAALLFPTFARVRESSRKTACMTQMHEIGQDVSLYQLDNHTYPTILMCNPYIDTTTLYTGTGTPLAANNVQNRPLSIGKYNADVTLFQCPDNAQNNKSTVFTGAVYPPGTKGGASTAWFYNFDSYDTGPQLNTSGEAVTPAVQEVHYSKDWTGGFGANDPPNQLKYPDPPADSTVITWCTYHVAIAHGDQIPVLLLNGSTRSVQYTHFIYQNASNPNGPLSTKF